MNTKDKNQTELPLNDVRTAPKPLQLNLRTSATGVMDHAGVRLYTDTLKDLDDIADRYNVTRSVLIRHALNEFLDSVGG